MGRDRQTQRIEWELLRRVLGQLRPHRAWLGAAVASTLMVAAVGFAGPYFVRGIADAAIAGNMRLFLGLVLGSLGFALFEAGAGYLKAVSVATLSAASVRDLRNQIASHIQSLPVATLDRYHTGDLVSRLNSDLDSCDAVFRRAPDYLHQPLQFVGGLAFMFALSPETDAGHLRDDADLGVCVRARGPADAAALDEGDGVAGRDERGDAGRGARGADRSCLQPSDRARRPLPRCWLVLLERHNMANRKRAIMSWPVFLMLRYIPQLIVPLYGGYMAFRGEISIGTLLGFDLLIWFVFLPLEALLSWIRELRETSPALARCYEILDAPAERRGGHSVPLVSTDGALEFDRVSFAYGGGRDVLDRLSFHVPVGRTVALVGGSGCGKSTVLKLLCGLHEPTGGEIRVLGQPIAVRGPQHGARSGLSRVSGHAPLPDLDRRQHRDGQAGGDAGRDRGRGEGGQRARLRVRPSPRLRHARGRTGQSAVGWREAEDRVGARLPQGRADPAARRADGVSRHGVRGPSARSDPSPVRREDDARRLP